MSDLTSTTASGDHEDRMNGLAADLNAITVGPGPQLPTLEFQAHRAHHLAKQIEAGDYDQGLARSYSGLFADQRTYPLAVKAKQDGFASLKRLGVIDDKIDDFLALIIRRASVGDVDGGATFQDWGKEDDDDARTWNKA